MTIDGNLTFVLFIGIICGLGGLVLIFNFLKYFAERALTTLERRGRDRVKMAELEVARQKEITRQKELDARRAEREAGRLKV